MPNISFSKTGNVREYVTFPLHRADSEWGERGMIETRQDTYTYIHSQTQGERHRRKQEREDVWVVFPSVVARCSCSELPGRLTVVPLEVIAGTGQTKCLSNANSGKRTLTLYHYVKRLRINHIKATILRQLCSHIFPSALPQNVHFTTKCSHIMNQNYLSLTCSSVASHANSVSKRENTHILWKPASKQQLTVLGTW